MSYGKRRSYRYKPYSGYYPSRRSISYIMLKTTIWSTLQALVEIAKAIDKNNLELAKILVRNKIYELETFLNAISSKRMKGGNGNAKSKSNNA